MSTWQSKQSGAGGSYLSFTLPAGLLPSSFARMTLDGLEDNLCNLTRGVLPTYSSIVENWWIGVELCGSFWKLPDTICRATVYRGISMLTVLPDGSDNNSNLLQGERCKASATVRVGQICELCCRTECTAELRLRPERVGHQAVVHGRAPERCTKGCLQNVTLPTYTRSAAANSSMVPIGLSSTVCITGSFCLHFDLRSPGRGSIQDA